jgi:phospholipid/cholesterol/gamma-HCH transport system permease protein
MPELDEHPQRASGERPTPDPPASGPFVLVIQPASLAVAGTGRWVGESIATLGGLVRLTLRALPVMVRLRFDFRRLEESVYHFGFRSLTIVCLAAFFVGMVLAVNAEDVLAQFGMSMEMSDIVAVSLVREMSPIFTALLLAGRASSGIAAELGSMKTTEQLEAMRMLGLDVTRLFVVPFLLATTFSVFFLCMVFDVVGIAGGYVIAVYQLQIPVTSYHAATIDALEFADVATGLVKAGIFGFAVGLVGCYYGLSTTGGGKGVGEYTKRAVVAASVIVLVSDFFLTKALMAFFA